MVEWMNKWVNRCVIFNRYFEGDDVLERDIGKYINDGVDGGRRRVGERVEKRAV